MKPVIALVGRPNVGKSTLFNRLTGSRDALVANQPGLTRDRKFGEGRIGGGGYLVVDTGGLTGGEQGLEALMAGQAWLAIEQADAVILLTDAREGLNPGDEIIAERLRSQGKCVLLAVNKAEGLVPEIAAAEFHRLALGDPWVISAAHGEGVRSMIDAALERVAERGAAEGEDQPPAEGTKVAVIGRPNVGKSTLVNRLLGEERVLVYDMPGTTRDSIYVPFTRDDRPYVLIDTAGVRRRRGVKEAIEKFSIVKTLKAVHDANVVIMVLDAREGVTDQDAHLLGFVVETGRALVLAVNKWDGLPADQRTAVRRELDLKLPFVDFAPVHFVSALHGSGVGKLMTAVDRAYRAATRELSTPQLTRVLEALVAKHQPPLVRGRRVKLRYAHQGGQNPPVIVIHGNQTDAVTEDYRRYLINAFRREFRLDGTPVRVEFKSGENPFRGRRNVLTPRQEERRKRLMRHVRSRQR